MVYKNKPVIAVTLGDPSGVGPEIIIKSLGAAAVLEACRPLVVGDRQILDAAARAMGKSLVLKSISRLEELSETEPAFLYEASHLPADQVAFGRPDPRWGKPTLEYIHQAAQWALQSRVAAMVTAPISKEIIRHLQPDFTGHTEYLAGLARTGRFGMMLAGERLRVSLATIHLSLLEAVQTLDAEKIIKTVELTHQTLLSWFGIKTPRIAVAGLNPHAGEKGAFGREEATIIQPALEALTASGLPASGPYPPDTLFYWAARGRYDAVVALYHDQGLIPLKLLHFDNAVNITMGLPFIRTSVDHGTAYDIAGKGLANPDSLIAAILAAAQFCRHQEIKPV
jgi:4-phospho-D-threonate 3-dehydrogenase / 4-phospho-D-erythronate 3-dehydrogenase